ncbi:hypothetical protein GQX73_g4407 [Xylaria multiplex]|uniref:RNase H type-1 domain-containing protein n=1 Tax=Xylaria multiplex TaxID=323545 RepID=A0A7C8IT21_9PEZI|nr:hypothetical protein GQX73_g4407 [Xylaria multiplex]
MPRGFYLAQGLIPLVEHSSDDDEGPCELPNGRLVCGPHGFVVCGKCCVDYSFMEDVLSHSEDEDDVLDAETEEMYWELSPESRAEIDARWGPPSSSRGSQPQTFNSSNARRSSTTDTHSTIEDFGIDLDDDGPGPKKRRGTGRVFPTRFTPPSPTITPTELFLGKATYARLTRYIHCNDAQKVLIFTDGACLNNGQANPKAGWALVHGPGFTGMPALIASGRLEDKGPFGDPSIQSSNRAELRAVIAALRMRHWTGEGFDTVVIATDSEYVTTGSTEWVKSWIKNGWQTAGRTDVKNKDLWEMLLGEVERWHDEGLSIQFWKIPREWNKVADAAAKKAAEESETPGGWMDIQVNIALNGLFFPFYLKSPHIDTAQAGLLLDMNLLEPCTATNYGIGFIITVLVVGAIRLITDPLRRIPGPFVARLTPIWLWYISWRGIECTVLEGLHKKYGSVVRIAPNELSISDGIAIPIIYIKNGGYLKSPVYRNVDVNGFATIFSVQNPEHRAVRAKAVAPLFASQKIVQGRPIFVKVVADMLAELEQRKHGAHGNPVDILNLVRATFMETVSSYLLGNSLCGTGEGRFLATEFVDSFASAGRFFLLPRWIFPYVDHWAAKLLKNRHAIHESTQYIQDFATHVVDKAKSGANGEGETYQARLLDAGISREETIAQVVDILFAGTDAVSRTFALLCENLAEHADKYERVRQEVCNNTDIDSQSLPYLSAVVKENLRLSMANPTRLPRIVPEGGLHMPGLPSIPAGTIVGLSAYSLHLNAEVFSSPHEFLPERWLEASLAMLRDSFYFGQGCRQCIARNLAWTMLCWAAEGVIRSDVLRDARPVKTNADFYQWFNAVKCNGEHQLIWE